METAAGPESPADDPGAPAADHALARALRDFVTREEVLVALDFDGTLAPIVDDPDDARPLASASAAIQALAQLPRTHVVVVSGRSLTELRRLLGPAAGVVLVGSHGAEIDDDLLAGQGGPAAPSDDEILGDEERQLLARVQAAMAGIVAEHPGTVLEEKPAAVVLHTRRAGREAAIGATGDALQGPGRWPGVHVLRGKEVVELAVSDVTKGRALRRLRTDLGLGRGGVLFAGDDATDERAFAVLDDDAGDVSVKVGDGRTAARHRVTGPQDLARLLVQVVRWRGGG